MSNSSSSEPDYHYKIEGLQIMATEAPLLVWTFALLVLRIYVRLRQRGKISWSEIFVINAWIFFAIQVGFDISIFKTGYFEYNDQDWTPAESMEITIKKLLWAENMTYYVCMYSVKLAMLCFLNEVIPQASHWRIFLAVRVVFALVCTGLIITEVGFLLKCQPITNAWSLDDKISICNTFPYNTMLNVFVISFHMGTDILIYLIPLFLLQSLRNLPVRQKIGAGVMFALGSLTILFGLFFFLTACFWLEVGYGWIFAASEQATAITVACLPCFKIWLATSLRPGFMRAMDRVRNDSTASSDSIALEKHLRSGRHGHVRLGSNIV